MSWKIESALKRVFNAFKRSKEKIYKEDIEALKLLNDELISMQKTYVNDNLLYAKLLCLQMKQNVSFYTSMPIALKSLHNSLKMPLSHHVEYLRMELNIQDTNAYFESLGLKMDNTDYGSGLEILTENQKEATEKLSKFWNYEKVERSFYNSANDYLKDINNYN